MSAPRYVVWARSPREAKPSVRCVLDHLQYAVAEAAHLARSSDPGVMSVWVQENDEIHWAAGEKARELKNGGVTIGFEGNIARDRTGSPR